MKSPWIRPVVVMALALGLGLAVGAEEARDTASSPALSVLLVSDFQGNEAQEIKKLLEEHNVAVTISRWQDATAEQAKAFNLVILGGAGRQVAGGNAVLDCGTPVLGLGPYGCGHFGLLHLKNGQPYT